METQRASSTSTSGGEPGQMKIESDGITFYSLSDFGFFLREFNLFGKVKLSKPLTDRTGKILYKENLYLKDSIFHKLEEMEGQYEPTFVVSLTNDLLKGIRISIGNKMLERLEAPENRFIAELYENTEHRYQNYVRNALSGNRSLIMTFFKLSRERRLFFNHLADMGLLTLGVIIQKYYKLKFINRFAFLAGVCLDLPFAGSELWKSYPDDETTRIKMARRTAQVAEKLRLAPEIIDSILNSPVLPSKPNASATKMDTVQINLHDNMDHVLESEENEETENQPVITENNEMIRMVLTETLKIARYINSVASKIEDQDVFAEELVYMVAYNAARGYFHKDLINPILRKFKRFEENARRMMRIAEIEKKCLYFPSAWAYPKPRASQILCKNRVTQCPLIDQGWEIHVVSRQEAFGWIGGSLFPDSYAKCKLEEQLEEIQ